MYKWCLVLLSFILVSCAEPDNPLQASVSMDVNDAAIHSKMMQRVDEMEGVRANRPPSASTKSPGLSSAVIPTEKYNAQWFTIEHPVTFTPRPQGPVDAAGRVVTDEAYFTAPDNSVEFFVFSPLWDGEPKYVDLLESEELLDKKIVAEKDPLVATKVTVKAKDGSYYRSFVTQQSDGALVQVFGITYKNQQAYDRYVDAYVLFVDSLMKHEE